MPLPPERRNRVFTGKPRHFHIYVGGPCVRLSTTSTSICVSSSDTKTDEGTRTLKDSIYECSSEHFPCNETDESSLIVQKYKSHMDLVVSCLNGR